MLRSKESLKLSAKTPWSRVAVSMAIYITYVRFICFLYVCNKVLMKVLLTFI